MRFHQLLFLVASCSGLGLVGCASISPTQIDKSGELKQDVRHGMTKEEVVAILGRPQASNSRTPMAMTPGMPEAMKNNPMFRAAETWVYAVSNVNNMRMRIQPLAAIPIAGPLLMKNQIEKHGFQNVSLTIYFDVEGKVIDSQRSANSMNVM
jgi:hypothetical protein